MDVSRQQAAPNDDTGQGAGRAAERGARARTRRLMLETATRLMQAGATPSVSEVAEAAEVSRATAYRYFPSQAALVQAVVDEGLGPILTWKSTSDDAERRVAELFADAMPRIEAFEATFKAALKLSLDQWARRQAGTLGSEPAFTRGHRVDLLKDAIAPLKGQLPPREFKRLAQALSLMFGVEVLIVLKDIWGLDSRRMMTVAQWAAGALVRAALAESEGGGASAVMAK
ncbi:TetR/AcrR family transcriptional regulator [Mesorhizobium sp. M4B.F.Ca.ET.215.01.1.1]|uniref:Helix-turn-helix domain-containing protein n=1 Tax=Mesorhizobium abyssinicae TaxID=1209958 RepID=A0ABU5AQQ0_9HYPH|nr:MULTISPECIES: TetR/AcrR family transcriptional regulator [Mesorhizobium]MDX8539620.1 helix-turn-helix domain-containing protein [Mesorhizobium abyssinicae]RUW25407.1 TetR/AcrR family transcriptional regulator [Mesorhizobium sp. M4B.F.Ca.ET.013.02.1.1]RVD37075.1 TetR/AcrR family transcriptional regulator [Mesorhizobium sp. M4B.F.Ca.ET.019.03.1.1]RWC90632.1 MAG: TetR/AcrR family transcriptional regulator [Mesorhizobium sp.]RWF65680.1 MAG: TetR/AcrR family transcriptional regulator [Mesorhizob